METMTANPAQHSQTVLFSAADSKLGSGKYGLLDNQEIVKGKNGNDVLMLRDVPLFRSGEFEDSLGISNLWETMHMKQMESNFSLLRDSSTFASVPVRCDHPSFFGGSILGNKAGNIVSVRTEDLVSPHDGQTYTYVLGDLEIIDESAQKNILNGLWDCRSAEIGTYRTNNKAEYWPTFMGVAFVDIPAVEGLNFSKRLDGYISDHKKSDAQDISLMTEERMEPQNDPTKAGQPPAPGTGPAFEFSIGGKKTSDFASVQAYVSQLETRNAALEQVQREAVEETRTSYAKGLIESGRVLAAHQDATIELCKGMSTEQFASYRTTMDSAPVNPVLGQYGSAYTAPGQAQGGASPEADRVAILKEQVSMHQASGKSVEQIKQFKSYKELVALQPTFSL